MKNEVFIERGKRLKACRMLTGKSLKEFSILKKMSYSNLSRYERGELPIAEKNVEKFLNLLVAENVFCTKEWLLHGEGEFPRSLENGSSLKTTSNSSQQNIPDISNELLIFSEIELFKSNNPSALIKCISDNSMHPLFKIGDYVGGLPLSISEYEKLKGHYCIVVLPENIQVIGKVFIRKDKIICLPKNINDEYQPIFEEVSRVKIYSIVFQRKVNKL